MSPEVSIGINETMYVGDKKVYAEQTQPTVQAGATAKHETPHAVDLFLQGVPIIKVSRVRNGNVLGYVQGAEPNAEAAAAADAFGHDGTSHDMHVVDMLGVDRNHARAAARSRLSPHIALMEEFAGVLEERGTMDGNEAEQVLQEINSGSLTTVFIENFDGTKRTEKTRADKNGKISIPNEWFPPAKAA